MTSEPPVLDGEPASPRQKQLAALFDEIESKQLEFLDQAGKRIVEAVTALVGVFFAVAAFGENFPPAYLSNSVAAKWLTVGAIFLYIAALITALKAIEPRSYRRYHNDLTKMREELDTILGYKQRWVTIAGRLFLGGTLAFALLIGLLLLAA